MLAEFLDKLISVANQSNVEPMEYEGRMFVPAHSGLTPLPIPSPTPLQVKSLSAITNYLKANRDELEHIELIVHVESPWQVSVRGALLEDQSRFTFMIAKPPLDDVGASFFGRPHKQEEMIVALQTKFRSGPNLDAVLKVIGNLTAEAVATGVDDGVSQEVATRAGIVRKGVETFRNPAMLVPRRSFPEISLDEVPFILRFNGGSAEHVPTSTLHEADGGAWQIDAMNKIAEWLEANRTDGQWGVVV